MTGKIFRGAIAFPAGATPSEACLLELWRDFERRSVEYLAWSARAAAPEAACPPPAELCHRPSDDGMLLDLGLAVVDCAGIPYGLGYVYQFEKALSGPPPIPFGRRLAEIVEARRRWRYAVDCVCRAMGVELEDEVNERQEQVLGLVDTLRDAIADASADTLLGFAIKARAVCWTPETFDAEYGSDGVPEIQNLLAGLLRIADEVLPPASPSVVKPEIVIAV